MIYTLIRALPRESMLYVLWTSELLQKFPIILTFVNLIKINIVLFKNKCWRKQERNLNRKYYTILDTIYMDIPASTDTS